MAVERFLELRPDAYQSAIERPFDEGACVDDAPELERPHLHDLERLRRLSVLFRAIVTTMANPLRPPPR